MSFTNEFLRNLFASNSVTPQEAIPVNQPEIPIVIATENNQPHIIPDNRHRGIITRLLPRSNRVLPEATPVTNEPAQRQQVQATEAFAMPIEAFNNTAQQRQQLENNIDENDFNLWRANRRLENLYRDQAGYRNMSNNPEFTPHSRGVARGQIDVIQQNINQTEEQFQNLRNENIALRRELDEIWRRNDARFRRG